MRKFATIGVPTVAIPTTTGSPMSLRTLYFDESGYTGYNLLDPIQPVFAVASSLIGDGEAETLMRRAFPAYRGSEFKFANIWKSGARGGFADFVQLFRDRPESTFVYFIQKKFGVLTKIVDFLIEPVLTTQGYDFYDEGFCWKFTNYIHFGLSQYAPALYEVLLRDYQTFSRDPTEEKLAQLCWRLRVMANSAEPRTRHYLQLMATGAEAFHHFNNLETFRLTSELQTTSMIATIAYWRQRLGEDFAVVHDVSSTFMRNREVWEHITNADVPEQDHRLGDGSFAPFPLRVVSTTPMDSKSSFAIQLCDLIAGLATKSIGVGPDDPDRSFLDDLLFSGLGDLNSNGIRPGPEFPVRIPPKRLVGPDAVDRMTAIIQGSKDRRATP